MSWKRWLPEYKVPQTIEKLVKAGVLKDKTSDRDVVPHFEAILSDGSDLVLWADHPDPEQRAVPDGPRYGLEVYQKERLPRTLFETNELEEALLALRGILEERGGMRVL
jgi:hypothetical protein